MPVRSSILHAAAMVSPLSLKHLGAVVRVCVCVCVCVGRSGVFWRASDSDTRYSMLGVSWLLMSVFEASGRYTRY